MRTVDENWNDANIYCIETKIKWYEKNCIETGTEMIINIETDIQMIDVKLYTN